MPKSGLDGSGVFLIYFVTDQNRDYIFLALFSDLVFKFANLTLKALYVARDIENVDGTYGSSEESGREWPVLLSLLPEPEICPRLVLAGHSNLLLLVVALLSDGVSYSTLLCFRLDVRCHERFLACSSVTEDEEVQVP